MINRRHLRIKVLQSLYAYFLGEETNYKKAETELIHSIERIYDLYLYLLLSFEELKTIHENKINENVIDQNRFLIGLGMNYYNNTRLEIGYLNHFISSSTSNDVINHTVSISLIQNLVL